MQKGFCSRSTTGALKSVTRVSIQSLDTIYARKLQLGFTDSKNCSEEMEDQLLHDADNSSS